MGEPPPHQLGGDINAGYGQKTKGTTAEKAMHIQMTPSEQRFKHLSPCSVPVATVRFKRKSKITKATPANVNGINTDYVLM